MTAIRVVGVTKTYGDRRVLGPVDLEVGTGEVVAILGPNGAGKTTLVEILEGFRRRDGGVVDVVGSDPEHPAAGWRDRVGVVLQSTGSIGDLTVREHLDHVARFYRDPVPAGELLDLVGLVDQAGQRCRRLSGGQLRRLDLAMGVIGRPEVLFLDEPTTGMDPVARRQIWQLVDDLHGRGCTTILTTHYLEEAEVLADRVVLLKAGQIVASSSPHTFEGRELAAAQVTFLLSGPLEGQVPPDLGGDHVRVERDDPVVEIRTPAPSAAVVALTRWSANLGSPELPGLTIRRATLENVYLGLLDPEGEVS